MNSDGCYKRFGERVRLCRELRGWNQTEVAKRVRLSRTSVTNIECGRQAVSLEMVERFAKAFHIPSKRLMNGVWR